MKHLALAFALAGSLALALPAAPAWAADESAQAIETASHAVDLAQQDLQDTFGKSSLHNGQFVWKDGAASVDRVVVDLSNQMAYAYDGDELVAASTISSGDMDHLSPIGVFSVLEKREMYHSKKYDNAPMPFMQRITETGVAMHGGALPGHPASHGCIRLPKQFAAKLFGATRTGTEVLVAEPEGPPTLADGAGKAASKNG